MQQCAAAVIHSREIRDVNQWRTVDVRVEPPTVAYSPVPWKPRLSILLRYWLWEWEARAEKNCITNIIIIEVDDACKLCKCQGTKAAHRTNAKQVDTITRATQTGWKRRENMGTRIVQAQAHPDRRVAQSSGTDPMADDEPRHCFFSVIHAGSWSCSSLFLSRSTAQSLVDNVRIVWKQFGTRVFFFFEERWQRGAK